jgi:DNA-binding transcriptional ArsR family regulator
MFRNPASRLYFKSAVPACDREAVFTKESVSAFMQDLSERAPAFAHYFDSVVEELEEMDMADDTREAYDLIQDAVDRGFQEETQIVKITKLSKDVVRHALTLMVDNGLLETIQQGGKTETARGARKTLYRTAEKKELEYVFEDAEKAEELEFASI